MKRIIAYKIRVKRTGAKLQFQIRLPEKIKGIKGIKISTNAS